MIDSSVPIKTKFVVVSLNQAALIKAYEKEENTAPILAK